MSAAGMIPHWGPSGDAYPSTRNLGELARTTRWGGEIYIYRELGFELMNEADNQNQHSLLSVPVVSN